uniref:Putative rRNA methyltransferase n=1 Tax=Anopheles farauti TaxID=69004 RepID=A0A182QG62_9DIPT
MVRVDLAKLRQLQTDASRVRNICILAHVDHGKTTLADSLIASNGIISTRLAGKLRYMDSRPDEQERQITMKSSSIALYFRNDSKDATGAPGEEECLVNLIDSPGHVDFSSEVSTAIRLCDGAIIVVDVVEGVCPQTRVCLQQAYNEQLSTVLLLNKIDRLVLEKRLEPAEAYHHLVQVLEQVNAVVGNLFASDVLAREQVSATADQTSALEEADDSFLYYTPQQGNVLFGSALDGWAFDLATFARFYAGKLEGVSDSEQLLNGLWGDYFYSPRRKAIEPGATEKGRKPLFVQLVLDNLWNIYGLVENRDEAKLRTISERCGVVQMARDLKHADARVPVRNLLSGWLPMERSLLGAICATVPNPTGINEMKAEKLLCSRLSDFESYPPETRALKQDIMRCDAASERLIVFVSKMFPIEHGALAGAKETLERLTKALSLGNEDQDGGGAEEPEIFLAFARVYSGTLRRGSKVFVIGPKYDPRTMHPDDGGASSNPHLVEVEIDSLFLLMGRQLEPVDSVPAGNIVGIGGLQNVVLKTATLSNTRYCPPFVDLPLIATPILRVAVEPKDIQKMPQLVRGLKLLNQADACVEVRVQESGEHVLLTLGEVHLERCIKDLQETYAKIELNVSKPIVPFKETIVPFVPTSEENPEEEIAKDREKDKTVTLQTPNRQSTIKLVALPLSQEVVELLNRNELVLKEYVRTKEAKQVLPQALQDSIGELQVSLKKLLPETIPFERLWSFGPKKCGTNMLVNCTDFKHTSVWFAGNEPVDEISADPRAQYESSFLNGFQMASLAGPLCDEPMQGVCFLVERWELDVTVGVDLALVASHGPLSGQIMSAVKEGCKKAFQNQPQRLVHPMYSCNITVNSDVLEFHEQSAAMGKKAKVGKDRRDKFYKLAKESGYRSRAAFKLIQLNRRFGFLQQSQVCLDLCAAPGGWMQVAKQNMPVSSIVIGVDLYPIKSVPGCISLIGDITSDKTKSDLAKELKTWKVDVVLNDGAPNVGKNWLHDAYQQVCLTLSAVKLATQFLRPGGWFITKVFRSKDYNALIWVLKQLFRKVHATKPSASRKESAEIFVVCQYYKAPDKIDPRFLDSKYVFEELDIQSSDISSSNILKDLERKTPKKPKVEGYDSTDVRKIVTALEFMRNDKPLALLSRVTEIKFTPGDDAIANHPRTTTELKECCKDIKILGRKDIKDLLRWHKLVSPEFAQADEGEEKSTDKNKKGDKDGSKEEENEDENVAEELVELKKLEKEIAALREEDERNSKRKRKQSNKERAKLNERLSLKMVIKGDEGPTEQGGDMVFTLKDVKSKQQLESILDQPPDVLPEEPKELKKPKKVRYVTKDDMYEDENLLRKDTDSESEVDSDFEQKGLAIESDDEELSFEEDEDAKDPSDDEDRNPLINDLDYRTKTDKRLQRAQLWYEQEAFQKHDLGTNDEEVVDHDLDKLIAAYKKAGVNVLGADKDANDKANKPLGRKAKRRARHDGYKADSSDSSSDEDEDEEQGHGENGTEEAFEKSKVGTIAHRTLEKVGDNDEGFEIVSSEKVRKPKKIKLNEEELALGQLLISGKKTRRDIIDAAYNRYMFNDSHLPEWFLQDEEQAMTRPQPVPDEVVEKYRKAKEEFNVRTIKKVMEAKARKKRHATKRLEKIKKKAETIMESVDNTNQEKIRLLKKLYKKADAKKKDVTYVVAKKTGVSGKKVRRPKGVEGRFKVVDPRMKKDRRAEKAKETRSKKYGKGKGKLNAKARAGNAKARKKQ